MSKTLRARLIALGFIAIIGAIILYKDYVLSNAGKIIWSENFKLAAYIIGIFILLLKFIGGIALIPLRTFLKKRTLKQKTENKKPYLEMHGYQVEMSSYSGDTINPPKYTFQLTKGEKRFKSIYTYEAKYNFFLDDGRKHYDQTYRIRECTLHPETILNFPLQQEIPNPITIEPLSFFQALVGNNKRDLKINEHHFDENYLIIGEYKNKQQNQENQEIIQKIITQPVAEFLKTIQLKKLEIKEQSLQIHLKGFREIDENLEHIINRIFEISKTNLNLPDLAKAREESAKKTLDSMTPEQRRVLEILTNFWHSLGDAKLFKSEYYAPEKVETFRADIEDANNMENAKIKTLIDPNIKSFKQKETSKGTQYTIVTMAKYYFEPINDQPLPEEFDSEDKFEEGTFKLTCIDFNGKKVATKIENSIY